MDATKQYINTLSGAVDLTAKSLKERKTGVSFAEVFAAVNNLDISAVMSDERTPELQRWLNVEQKTPEHIKRRWDELNPQINEYKILIKERQEEFLKRYGKNPAQTYFDELIESIDERLAVLIRAWKNPVSEWTERRFQAKKPFSAIERIYIGLVKNGFLSEETPLNDFQAAMGINDEPYKKIKWKKADRNGKPHYKSLLDFLCILNVLEIKTLSSEEINGVFAVEIKKDTISKFRKKGRSECHEELEKIINGK